MASKHIHIKTHGYKIKIHWVPLNAEVVVGWRACRLPSCLAHHKTLSVNKIKHISSHTILLPLYFSKHWPFAHILTNCSDGKIVNFSHHYSHKGFTLSWHPFLCPTTQTGYWGADVAVVLVCPVLEPCACTTVRPPFHPLIGAAPAHHGRSSSAASSSA